MTSTTQAPTATATQVIIANNSTQNFTANNVRDPKACGSTTCPDGSSCYIAFFPQSGSDLTIVCIPDASQSPPYNWRLNASTFPPFQYTGFRTTGLVGQPCEHFPTGNGQWATWVQAFAFEHWLADSSTKLQDGMFFKALFDLGSCFDNFRDTRSYCDYNTQICRQKLNSTQQCQSSNQCQSGQCGSKNDFPGGPIAFDNSTYKCSGSTTTLNLLTGNNTRSPNLPNPSDTSSDPALRNGQTAVVGVCIIIIVISLSLIAYARRIFSKRQALARDSAGNGDGQSSMGQRIRRGASLLLNRTNSVATLPPYRAVDDQSVNLMTSLPPGELPPPYEVDDSRNGSNITVTNDSLAINIEAPINNNTEGDASIQEVRDGVTFERVPSPPVNSVSISRNSTLSEASRGGDRGSVISPMPPVEDIEEGGGSEDIEQSHPILSDDGMD